MNRAWLASFAGLLGVVVLGAGCGGTEEDAGSGGALASGNAVNAEPLCTFSAATCSAEPADAQPYYINDCLVLIATTTGAWQGNPPAACR
jgi:hypothetical protein